MNYEETGVTDELLKQFYDGYYNDDVAKKREIAARQSVNHIRKLASSNQGTLLDVGAGDGAVLAEMERRDMASRMDAVEISMSGIERIKSRNLRTLRSVQQFDGYKLPFPDRSFNTVIAVHVLEHVEHERIFLRELARVAGRVYIEVPLEHTFRLRRSVTISKPYGHLNFYTQGRFLQLLESCGLQPIKSKVFPNSLAYEQFLSGKTVGAMKHSIRAGALKLAPFMAPRLATYLGAALCFPVRKSDD